MATKTKSYRQRALERAKVKHLVQSKSKTVPDMALSVQEIVRRFTRGLPLEDIQRQGTYVDQTEGPDEVDLEKLSRSSFDEKREFADRLRERNEALEASAKRRLDELAKKKEQAEAHKAKLNEAQQQRGEGAALSRAERSEGQPLSRVSAAGTPPRESETDTGIG